MKLLIIVPFILLLCACASAPPRLTPLEQDRADCNRLGGQLEVQTRDVYCHLPNGRVLNWFGNPPL